MEPNCQLEEFFVTRLHLDHREIKGPEKPKPQQLAYGFDYSVGQHKEEAHRYRMAFRVVAEEFAENEQPAGLKLESEIVGFLAINPELDKAKREEIVRLNGVSILYGILRGIVATMTGTFPNGKLTLPAALPADIVKHVEEQKRNTQKDTGRPAEKPVKKLKVKTPQHK
jgi:hypothetical protein